MTNRYLINGVPHFPTIVPDGFRDPLFGKSLEEALQIIAGQPGKPASEFRESLEVDELTEQKMKLKLEKPADTDGRSK